jgi:hypothetical protein
MTGRLRRTSCCRSCCAPSARTTAAYARELALFFFAFCERGGEAVYSVRAEHVEDYLKRRSRSIGTFDRDFLSWLGADRGAIDTTGPACSM